MNEQKQKENKIIGKIVIVILAITLVIVFAIIINAIFYPKTVLVYVGETINGNLLNAIIYSKDYRNSDHHSIAIVNTNIVKPGETLKGGIRVVKINRDCVEFERIK